MATKTISSRANAAFKLLQAITTSARARREHLASWIEGERLCEAYLNSSAPPAIAVITPSDAPKAAALTDRYPQRLRETWVIDKALFSSISPVETSVGWGLVIPLPACVDLTAGRDPNGDVVVLDRIQDPGNLGTILRSAAAAGVRHAWCTVGTTDPWSPKALRSAMGGHFVMSISPQVSDQQVIDAARKHRLALLATAHASAATSLFSPGLNLHHACAWVFGNEADGISKTLLASAETVMIPQSEDVESLNVAAAASICLFEMRRRRL